MLLCRPSLLSLLTVLRDMLLVLVAAGTRAAMEQGVSLPRGGDRAPREGAGQLGVVGTEAGPARSGGGGLGRTQAKVLCAWCEGWLELCAVAADVCALGSVEPCSSVLLGEQQAAAAG